MYLSCTRADVYTVDEMPVCILCVHVPMYNVYRCEMPVCILCVQEVEILRDANSRLERENQRLKVDLTNRSPRR